MNNMIKGKVNKVIEMVKARGINVELNVKNDNGVERIGFVLGDGSVRPTLYPDVNTDDLESIVNYLINGYEQTKDSGNELKNIADRFTDFDFAKKDIIPVLVKECEDEIISRNFLDLKIMYRYIIPNQNASIAIRKSHLGMWDKTEDDIYNLALENARDSFTDISMSEALDIPMPDGIGMRIITNVSKNYGATALLYPELFAKYGNSARILPSSIHEVIVVTNNLTDDDDLAAMIMSVNETELNPEDVLSNHPYKYIDGMIKEAE